VTGKRGHAKTKCEIRFQCQHMDHVMQYMCTANYGKRPLIFLEAPSKL